METRKEQKERRRQEIINAALELFVSKGYAATKITDIAKMYGFSGSSYFSEMFKKTLGITPRAFYKSVLQQQTLSSNADPIHGRR